MRERICGGVNRSSSIPNSTLYLQSEPIVVFSILIYSLNYSHQANNKTRKSTINISLLPPTYPPPPTPLMCELKPSKLRIYKGTLTVMAMFLLLGIMLTGIFSARSYGSGIHFVEAAVNWYREPILDITVVNPTTGTCTNDKQ